MSKSSPKKSYIYIDKTWDFFLAFFRSWQIHDALLRGVLYVTKVIKVKFVKSWQSIEKRFYCEIMLSFNDGISRELCSHGITHHAKESKMFGQQ